MRLKCINFSAFYKLLWYNSDMSTSSEQFAEATDKWSQLRSERQFSVPPAVGRTAILYAQKGNASQGNRGPTMSEQTAYFLQEAKEIQASLRAERREAEITELGSGVFKNVMQDREISDIVVIGHGTLSTVSNKPSRRAYSGNSSIDWYDLAQLTTHLKLGSFTQRMCGQSKRALSVPFGLFAVSDHSHVIAAVGQYFSPEEFGSNEEAKLQPFTSQSQLTEGDIVRLFPQQTDGAFDSIIRQQRAETGLGIEANPAFECVTQTYAISSVMK